MEMVHRPQNCRWGRPTLLLPHPFWCDAWKYPWACAAQAVPRPLPAADACALCPRWEAVASEEHAIEALPQDRQVANRLV